MNEEPTVGKLVVDALDDVKTLVRSEIELAKAELKSSLLAGGVGALLLVVGGFLGLMIIVLASITLAYFFVMAGLDPAWAFLIVTGIYVLLAVVAVIAGILLLKRIRAPKQTIATAAKIPAAFRGESTS